MEGSPLFITGPVRSGTTLFARMLSVHRDVTIASDPYFPFFRSLRNAVIISTGGTDVYPSFRPAMPLQDYYFSEERIRMMKDVQASDLHLAFDLGEWETFFENSLARVQYECPDFVPYLTDLKGQNYLEILDHGLEIIAKVRNAHHHKWVGLKEVWIIEFFILLAHAYPNARFIVIMRDPRAISASTLAVGDGDPSQAAHPLSLARHWRKYAAFLTHYQYDPLFRGRLLAVGYEHLVEDPEKVTRKVTDFLEIPYDASMLDASNYLEYSTGKARVWEGNSSFEKKLTGISAGLTEKWRRVLTPEIIKMIDFTCAPEMKLIGYQPERDMIDPWQDADILEYIIKTNDKPWNWRSDFGDPQQDYGFELFRRALPSLAGDTIEKSLIHRAFLFEDVFEKIRQIDR